MLVLSNCRTWMLACWVAVGTMATACNSGSVHTVLGPPEDAPPAPRTDEHGPQADGAGGAGPSITPAGGAAGVPDDAAASSDPNGAQGSQTGPQTGAGGPTDGGTSQDPNGSGAPGDPNAPIANDPNTNAPPGLPNTPTDPNGVPPPGPSVPSTPLEACHQAWLAQGFQATYGDPFTMPAAQDPNWAARLRVDDIDVEARPAQTMQINLDPARQESTTCAVPTAWSVQVLTPGIDFDPFLRRYQRGEPIRRQLATAGLAMEEKSFTSWQDFSERELWLAWTLRPYAPSAQLLQDVALALGAPTQQQATWHTAVETIQNTQTPGLAVSVGADADPTHALFWGVLSDAVRASADTLEAGKAFLAVAPAASNTSFHGAIVTANVWPWHRLASWDVATQRAMACEIDADTFEGRCEQRLPAYASLMYRETVAQGTSLWVHLLWETQAKQEAFVTTVRVDADGAIAVEKTQRFEAVTGLRLPTLDGLHALPSAENLLR